MKDSCGDKISELVDFQIGNSENSKIGEISRMAERF